MTWETFSCCCNQAPCICAGVYSSITVKWTGKVIFSPLPCREYWRRWVSNPSSGCGLPSRLSLVGPTTYEIPSIVVPGLNVSSCLSYACVNRQSAMNRHFASFTPFPGSPEYFDPIVANTTSSTTSLDRTSLPIDIRSPSLVRTRIQEADCLHRQNGE